MKFIKYLSDMDKIRNEIISILNIFSINDNIEENETKSKDHVIELKKVMDYRTFGKRDFFRPRKRWLDDRNWNNHIT